MGLMNFIRQNLPEAWEKASTEMKMKTELINRLHANVPRQYKNKYHYREGMMYIRGVFRRTCSIYYLVEATDLDMDRWRKLDDAIKNYEETCR